MTSAGQDVFASPFHAILAWSEDWPMWQRDALRRIVVNGQLSADDNNELELICKSQHDPDSGVCEVLSPIALATEHLPTGPDATASVSLIRLADLQHVNRLPSDQFIEFGPAPGLTVVYGETGAGKSGYVRVIKKACRARGAAPEIKANAFDGTAHGPASAIIVCSVGTVEAPCSWTDGSPSDPRLSNIFVFDTTSAQFHAGHDGPAVFTPRGLDVLPALAAACDELRGRFKTQIDLAQSAIRQAEKCWTYKPDTTVGKLLSDLGATTSNTDIDSAAIFTAEDQKRLAELADALESDPRQKAGLTAAAATRLREFGEAITASETAVGDASVSAITTALAAAAAATAAVKATSDPTFDDSFLPGTGGDGWRQLWDIARSFSVADAYAGKEFPVSEAGARCVLCQQALDTESKERFARFDQYVRDEMRVRAEAAEAQVELIKQNLETTSTLAPEYDRITADLAGESLEVRSVVETFVKEADARLEHIRQCLRQDSWTEPAGLSPSPSAILASIADALEARAQTELSADDPAKRRLLIAERDELTDKEWLVRNKGSVLDQLARHKKMAVLKQCQQDCITNTITRKGGELHDAVVSKAFCERFAAERDLLRLATLPVKLESTRGAKGERQFGLRLDGVESMGIVDIASEGEHRCAALAAFLAELSQSSHDSALVFDDPVSSLDHKRKAAIADRLVVESKTRQVVVFTHDLAFVCDLQHAADHHKVELHGRHIDWSSIGPGRCHQEFPWEAQSSKEQMKTLRERCGKAEKIHREQGEAEYRDFALPVCDHIRAAAERIVEEQLLAGILRRHQSGIHMGKLELLASVEVAEYQAVHQVWKDCSDMIPSHSASRSRPAVAPEPAALARFVSTLEEVIEAVKKRRKALQEAAASGTTTEAARAKGASS